MDQEAATAEKEAREFVAGNEALSSTASHGVGPNEHQDGLFPLDEKLALESKCLTKGIALDQQETLGQPNLFVFMSFSIPLQTWQDLSGELERVKGVFVLNGIPNNSFLEFAAKVDELRKAGVNAPIRVDPPAFKKFGVEWVPAMVLTDGKSSDVVWGNILLKSALKLFAEGGSLKEQALEMAREMDGT